MRKVGFLGLLALTGALVACDSSVDAPETARLTIMLTDAPGELTEAVVTITQIYLQGDPTEDDENGRVILSEDVVTTDLLTLANDVQTLVDGATIAAGTYGQLRFVIEGAYIVVEGENGDLVYATPNYAEAPAQVDGELKCPSCGTSGIKVSLNGGLTFDTDSETLLVDFDVAESFGHEAGNSGKWILHPSLKGSNIVAGAAN